MNKHRGSDFNEFLIEEGIMTPTPTPRTDAIAHRGLGSVAYIAEMTEFARELERENHAFRAAQKAREDCDAPRVDRIAELERELAAERELADRLQKSAQAVVDRWETPAWKDAPHTGKFIRSLDDALAVCKGAAMKTPEDIKKASNE